MSDNPLASAADVQENVDDDALIKVDDESFEPVAKKQRMEKGNSDEMASINSEMDWEGMMEPHPDFLELVKQRKIVAPQASKKTIWWRCFHTWNLKEFGEEVEQPLAYCNICGKPVKLSKVDRSPTPLKRHLQIHHPDFFDIMHRQKVKQGPLIPVSTTYHPSRTPKKGKKDIIRSKQMEAIARWIIDTDQPLDIVESESFRAMTAALVFNARHENNFDRYSIGSHIRTRTEDMLGAIRDMLAGCTIVHVQESWRTSGNHTYSVDRAHWIDKNFKLRHIALACNSLGEEGQIDNALWTRVGVNFQTQVPITVSNNTGSLPTGGPVTPIFRGLEYELQQIANVALHSLGNDANRVLHKVRGLVKKVQSSGAVRRALKSAQADLKTFYPPDHPPIKLVVDTIEDNWWSTQEMIGRLLYLRKAYEYLLLDNRLQIEIDHLERDEWELLEKLQMIWEPLSIAPQLLQKQKFVSVGLVPIILQIIGEDLESIDGQEDADPEAMECLTKMKNAWVERFGEQFPSNPFQGINKSMWLAHVLDPRFKSLHLFESSENSAQVIFDALLEKMVEISLEDKSSKESGTGMNGSSAETPAKSQTKKDTSKPASIDFRQFASKRSTLTGGTKRGMQRLSERFSFGSKTEKKNETTGGDKVQAERDKIKAECEKELSEYKEIQGMRMWIEMDDGAKEFEDPLTWWQEQHGRFPTLWKLAQLHLAVPATCAPSERAFDPEADAVLAERCRSHHSNSGDVNLLKENAGALNWKLGTEATEEAPVESAPAANVAAV